MPTDPEQGALNVGQLIDTGAIGLNFEDQVVGGEGLHPVAVQSSRISAIRAMAGDRGVELFINARTDLFLKEKERRRARGADAGGDCPGPRLCGGRRQRVFSRPVSIRPS